MKSSHLVYRTILLILLAIFISALAPEEKTLGSQARLIYFHGGWVWAALVTFGISGVFGLYGFVSRKGSMLAWSIALQRSALAFWLLFLPMSLWVMQVSWNGLFLAEPRFRIPFNFAIIGLIFQVATTLMANPRLSGLVNFLFVGGLFWALRGAEYILHPQMPILNSQAGTLRYVFFALVIFLSGACWSLADLFYHSAFVASRSSSPSPQTEA
ncbi:MAG: hypothetical protein DDG59_02555 [Anaerolineae bacterium]|nr:MAG: hypothetical protein DDG59_02555 [Anaerolineae bacterium]